MRPIMMPRCLATLVLAGSLGLAETALAAELFPPLTREPILESRLPEARAVDVVKGARIRFAPGQPTGAHLHPVPVVGVVTAGSFVFQIDGEAARTLRTGDGFYEPANAHILKFDNASATEAAEIAAFYLTDKSDPPLIKMLDAH